MRAGFALLAAGLRGHRRSMLILLFWSGVEAIPALLSGQFLKEALDHGFLAHDVGVGFLWLGALLAAMVVAAAATRVVYPRLATVIEPLRDALVRRVVVGSLTAPGHRSGGADPAAIARLTEQVELVRRLLSALIRSARQFGLAIVATVIGVTVIAPVLVVLVAPPLVLSLGVFALLLPRLAGRQRAVLLADEVVSRDATNMLHGLRDVLACQAADRAGAELGAVVEAQATASRELARVSALRVLIVALGVQLPLVVLLAAGPSLIHSGRLTAGALVAAVSYLTVTLEPALRALVQVAGTWVLQLAVVLSRLAEVAAGPEITAAPEKSATGAAGYSPNGSGAGSSVASSTAGYALRTAGLTFGYGPHADPVISDLELTVAEGEHLAVVGPSGAGKSTLADLVSGLITPWSGQIQLGGLSLQRWERARLHEAVALIPQEAYVFAGSVADNVGYLNPGARHAELAAAVDAVGMWELLDRLGGWDATVHRRDLAAGEQQLIALARAYASPARLVILDEASCYLDQPHEALVERAFRDRTGSLIVIAHRIGSARRADRILVLDGVSAVTGGHEELLEASPLYAELVGHWDRRPDVPRSEPS